MIMEYYQGQYRLDGKMVEIFEGHETSRIGKYMELNKFGSILELRRFQQCKCDCLDERNNYILLQVMYNLSVMPFDQRKKWITKRTSSVCISI